MVGRSTSWVDKIETGERSLVRLPMLERVAEALGIDPTALTDSSAAQRAADCTDAGEVQAIRAALGRYPSVVARDTDRHSVTLNTVVRQLAYVERAWSSSHFTVVSQHLPRLLGDAQIVVLTTTTADQVAAHRALVVAYRLASSMLLKFNANDIAWLAADRAMHQEAEAAADRMGPRHDTHQTSFGRANVVVHRVAALVWLHEGGRALEYAQGIDAALLGTLPPERKANYLLDQAQALVQVGRYPDAARTLGEAEHVAAEEVRCRPLAHGLLRSLLDTTQLAELTGLGAHIVVLPFVNQGLAANPVFVRSIEELRQAGVRVLFGPGEFEPHPPRMGGAVLDSYPWDRALAAAAQK